MDIDVALAIYEVFQSIIEANYHGLRAMDVSLVHGDLRISIDADEPRAISVMNEGLYLSQDLENGLWQISLGGAI